MAKISVMLGLTTQAVRSLERLAEARNDKDRQNIKRLTQTHSHEKWNEDRKKKNHVGRLGRVSADQSDLTKALNKVQERLNRKYGTSDFTRGGRGGYKQRKAKAERIEVRKATELCELQFVSDFPRYTTNHKLMQTLQHIVWELERKSDNKVVYKREYPDMDNRRNVIIL